jgi:acyl-CoA synthetase (AMP-forming)/AMP-acid ligase II
MDASSLPQAELESPSDGHADASVRITRGLVAETIHRDRSGGAHDEAAHVGPPRPDRLLIAHVKERKGGVMAPKSVEFVEAIPLTAVGKHDKKALRERYWSGRERAVN